MLIFSKTNYLAFFISLFALSFNVQIVHSMPINDSLYNQFVEFLNHHHCSKLPEKIIYPKNANDLEDILKPLNICKTPDSLVKHKPVFMLCNEIFEVLTNITCNSNDLMEEINVPLSTNVCEDLIIKQELVQKQNSIAKKLSDNFTCGITCGEYENACKLLLWGYEVQGKISEMIAQTNPTINNDIEKTPVVEQNNLPVKSIDQHTSENENVNNGGEPNFEDKLNDVKDNIQDGKNSQDIASQHQEKSNQNQADPVLTTKSNDNGRDLLGNYNKKETLKQEEIQPEKPHAESNDNTNFEETSKQEETQPEQPHVESNTQPNFRETSKQEEIQPEQSHGESNDHPEFTTDSSPNVASNKDFNLNSDVDENKKNEIPQDSLNTKPKISDLDLSNNDPSNNNHKSKNNIKINTNQKNEDNSYTKILEENHSEKNKNSQELKKPDHDNDLKISSKFVLFNITTKNKTTTLEENIASYQNEKQKETNSKGDEKKKETKSEFIDGNQNEKISNNKQEIITNSNTENKDINPGLSTTNKNHIELNSNIENKNQPDLVSSTVHENKLSSNSDIDNYNEIKPSLDVENKNEIKSEVGETSKNEVKQELGETNTIRNENQLPLEQDQYSQAVKNDQNDAKVSSDNSGSKTYVYPQRNTIGRGTDEIQVISPFPEQEGHFFFYFVSIVVILMVGYLLIHNKQKIIALIVEGRHERRRRSHGVGYKKLETK